MLDDSHAVQQHSQSHVTIMAPLSSYVEVVTRIVTPVTSGTDLKLLEAQAWKLLGKWAAVPLLRQLPASLPAVVCAKSRNT